jgi:phage-related minor tail protein
VALTVGQLLATVGVDDSGMRSGLSDAEGQMRRAGSSIGSDAERAGQRAGRALGDGVQEGARRGAEGAGDAIADEAGDGAEEAGGSLRDRLATGLKTGIAAVGAAAGALLMEGIGTALEQGKIVGRLKAQLGATTEEAQRYGKIAGELYSDAVTEDFQGAADAISAVMRAGIAPPDATNAQIKTIATNVTDLADTFELDLGQTANAVGQMIKTGLAKDGVQAVDALTAGLQKMGPRADDIADTFNEYSVIFQRLGIDATTATGLLSQGMKAGARDTDVVADALKEFTLEGVQGSAKIAQGFKDIGLNSDAMIKKISKGGPDATEALQMTLDALRKMEDPVKRDAAATELFGTKSEDMQKALLALDPSKATDALGKVGGKAKEMGDSLRDNAGVRIEQFKRKLQQNVVDFLGAEVLPAMDSFKGYVRDRFGSVWAEAGKGSDGMADRITSAFEIVGQRLVQKVKELAPKAISALMGFGQQIADYAMANPEKIFKATAIAGAILLGLTLLPLLIAAGLSAAAATIMVSFAAKLVTATTQNLPHWWDQLQGWFGKKAGEAGDLLGAVGTAIGHWFAGLWSQYVSGPLGRFGLSFVSFMSGLPGRAVSAISSLGSRLASSATSAFNRFRSAAADRAVAVVSLARGLPGRIVSAVGSLGSLLYGQGRNVAQGLWRGIQSMGGWLRSTLVSWAKSVIPGPIAKALGIASPSKVMAKLARWIPAGVVKGVQSGAGAVRSAMTALVTPPEVPSMAGTGAAAYAGAGGFGGFGAGGPSVQIEHWHAAENGTPEDNAKALEWLAKGRG